ncbi:MAG: CpsB/CapC family capsule biosynthesis tyrosine phosphatase [Acutalibacteraceae bacterium]|nr:CpsB/CapC family capsule biosynthesis tyrosine phosphatase [Acutalibacteraceae bacterium]
MVDLHCHILPGIDDGAKTKDVSITLLDLEKNQGVDSLVFTPHFKIDKISPEDFLQARNKSFDELKSVIDYNRFQLNIKLGAEVLFSVSLLNIDLKPFCYQDTDYILVELPVKTKPYGLFEVFNAIINDGYIPIIAHIERYPYFAEDPILLYELVMMGCLTHINAETVIQKNNLHKIVMKYFKWQLVHFVCSDCHSINRRPPNLKEAYQILQNSVGKQYTDWLIKNSENVFYGNDVDLSVVKKPKNFLGMWI